MNNTTYLSAKWIITETEILENHVLAIKNGLIEKILPIKNLLDEQTIKIQSYPNHVLLPGLINAHTHIPMSYFRGLADDLSLMDWLKNYIWPAEEKWVHQDFVYDASLYAMAEMIRGGTTCFNDMYFFLSATARAAEVSGMRAHIGITVLDFPTNWAKTTDDYFAHGIEFLEQYKNNNHIVPTLAPHAPYTVSDQTFLRVKKLAEEYQLKINLHLHETADEVNESLKLFNKRPIQRVHDLGLLSSNLNAIHMTQINAEDLRILETTQPSVVHCPESNMKLASGACPIHKLKSIGINIALGTDSVASNNDLNMLGEMRTATLLAKLVTGNPEALPSQETLQLATLNSARALGIEKKTGSIKVGKAADIIAINLDEIETLPLYHPISQIIYAASRQQVTDVWISGKQVLKSRKLLTLDEEELKAKCHYWNQKMKKNHPVEKIIPI